MRLAICSVLIGLMGVVASLGGEPEMPRVLKGHNSSVNCVVFSPDSKLLASASAGDVRLWDVASEKTPCPSVLYRDSNYFNSLAFSPDGKILAGGSECRWIWLWDVRARIRITTTDTRAVDSRPDHSSCVAFRPDGKTLASWSSDFDGDDQAITLWDVATHKNTGRIKVKLGRGMWFVFSPDCKIFAVGNFVEGDKRVELYDTATGKKRTTLKVDAREPRIQPRREDACVSGRPQRRTLGRGNEQKHRDAYRKRTLRLRCCVQSRRQDTCFGRFGRPSY